MKEFFSHIHYSNHLTLFEQCVSFILLLFVPFYACGALFKNFLYKNKILETHKIEGAKVISIGNITTGGVGKTPIVAELANNLASFHKVAILSRGYGGELPYEEVSVIKSNGEIHYNAKQAGDEPIWLSNNTASNVNVLTCANRVDSANYAVKKLGCDILILDDGFQHQQIERDLNIVVFDAYKMLGNGFVLPLGPLREPICAIQRADKILLTNKNLTQDIMQKVQKNVADTYKKPVYTASFSVDKIYNIHTHFEMPPIDNIAAFCAIGQPMLFYQYLQNYHMKFVKSFDDHHSYTQEDIDDLVAMAQKYKINGFVTTEKDAVKLLNLDFKNIQVYALKLKLDLDIKGLLDEET